MWLFVIQNHGVLAEILTPGYAGLRMTLEAVRVITRHYELMPDLH
jgi:hypothetical protein